MQLTIRSMTLSIIQQMKQLLLPIITPLQLIHFNEKTKTKKIHRGTKDPFVDQSYLEEANVLQVCDVFETFEIV